MRVFKVDRRPVGVSGCFPTTCITSNMTLPTSSVKAASWVLCSTSPSCFLGSSFYELRRICNAQRCVSELQTLHSQDVCFFSRLLKQSSRELGPLHDSPYVCTSHRNFSVKPLSLSLASSSCPSVLLSSRNASSLRSATADVATDRKAVENKQTVKAGQSRRWRRRLQAVVAIGGLLSVVGAVMCIDSNLAVRKKAQDKLPTRVYSFLSWLAPWVRHLHLHTPEAPHIAPTLPLRDKDHVVDKDQKAGFPSDNRTTSASTSTCASLSPTVHLAARLPGADYSGTPSAGTRLSVKHADTAPEGNTSASQSLTVQDEAAQPRATDAVSSPLADATLPPPTPTTSSRLSPQQKEPLGAQANTAALSPSEGLPRKQDMQFGLARQDAITETETDSATRKANHHNADDEDVGAPSFSATSSASSALRPSSGLNDEVERLVAERLMEEKEKLTETFEQTLREERIALEDAYTQRAAELQATNDLEIRHQRTRHEREVEKERLKTLSELADLKGKLRAIEEVFDNEMARKATTDRINGLLLASLAVEEAMANDKCVKGQLHLLRQLGHDDPVLNVVFESLAEEHFSLDTPVPTVQHLQDTFQQFSKDCAHAAFVPPGWGLLGHALASIFSSLYLLDKDPTAYSADLHRYGAGPLKLYSFVKKNLDRLKAARYYVDRGNLLEALGYVEEMEGLCGDVSAAWARDVRRVLTLRQALTVVRLRLLLNINAVLAAGDHKTPNI